MIWKGRIEAHVVRRTVERILVIRGIVWILKPPFDWRASARVRNVWDLEFPKRPLLSVHNRFPSSREGLVLRNAHGVLVAAAGDTQYSGEPISGRALVFGDDFDDGSKRARSRLDGDDRSVLGQRSRSMLLSERLEFGGRRLIG